MSLYILWHDRGRLEVGHWVVEKSVVLGFPGSCPSTVPISTPGRPATLALIIGGTIRFLLHSAVVISVHLRFQLSNLTVHCCCSLCNTTLAEKELIHLLVQDLHRAVGVGIRVTVAF